LILVDLDHFKAINDGLGHDAGDALLRHVAKVLQSALRRTDVVARIGGDEFAILLSDIHADADIKNIMQKLQAKLSEPIQISGQNIVPMASMGVARFPRDARTPEELMKSADLALYQRKRGGRKGYTIYNLSMRRESTRRTLLIDRLKQALARDEFIVALQPQHDMSNGMHTGFESLVRWKVGRRWIAPEALISVAEEAGLITQVSYQLIDKAMAIMARLKLLGLKPGTLAINVVAAQLLEPSFVENLMRLLCNHGLEPSELEIEVTENVILDRSAESIARVLGKLHEKGMPIALDDFGMGYASLTHLKRFSLNKLKIDRSFVNGLMEQKDDHVIVRTIISLAHNLGLTVIAEGVETDQQYQELSKLGCDAAQGYLIGRPMDEGNVRDYLERNRHAGPNDAP
jgi:diguanylate cyclase (GGDEF)-like protein